jgi:hypothetical protein
MCQVPRYDAHALLDLNAHCLRADTAWQRAVVIGLISLWPR